MRLSHFLAANAVIPVVLVGCSHPAADTLAETRGQAEQAQITGTTCVTIQRTGGSGAVADTEIASDHTTKNYGGKTTIDDGLVGQGTRHALLRFDLSAIPPAVHVTSAEVRLAATGSGSDVRVHWINAPWDEGAVTWQSFGGAFDPDVQTTFSGSSGVFDIQLLTQWWADGMLPNHGMLLEQAEGSTAYATSESPHLANRPSLTVCYACHPGFADCDGDAENGCETWVDTADNCGACGVACASPSTCTDGVCTPPPPPPASCTPLTCADLGHGCGPSSDGCGSLIDCGSCTDGYSCGAAVPYWCGGCDGMNCLAPNVCMGGACVPPPGGCDAMSCPGGTCIEGYCLPAGDPPCDPMICPAPFAVCTTPVSCLPAGCTPLTCEQQGIACGPAGDGCGGVIQCGSCPMGETCGGGGQPFVCGSGASTCNPMTCPPPNACTDSGVCVPPVDDGTLCDPMNCPPPSVCTDMYTCSPPTMMCDPMTCPPPGMCVGDVCVAPM